MKVPLLLLVAALVRPVSAQHRAPPPHLAQASRAIDRAAAAISGRVGVAATVLETGDQVALHGNERFPMQSVYKVPIAMAVLQQVDADKFALNRVVHVRKSDLVPGVHSPLRDDNPAGTDVTVRELLRGAVVESDGTASDMLLTLVPATGVTAKLRQVGIDSMVVATTERAMTADVMVQYRNWSTPRAAVQLLRALQSGRGVSASSRALLLGWMTETAIGDKRIKALLPKGTVVAHKTGLDATHGGLTRATNDIGLVTLPDGRHLALAVFIRDSRSSEAAREAAIARIARAVWDAAVRRK